MHTTTSISNTRLCVQSYVRFPALHLLVLLHISRTASKQALSKCAYKEQNYVSKPSKLTELLLELSS
jgi:hypothetical protein